MHTIIIIILLIALLLFLLPFAWSVARSIGQFILWIVTGFSELYTSRVREMQDDIRKLIRKQ